MTDKELIRRALLGDQEAQKECTEKGIVLPCQVCGAELEKNKVLISDGKTDMYRWTNVYQHPKNTNCVVDSIWFEANKLSLWNTRPAPPVGRCEDCKWSRQPTEQDYIEIGRDVLSYKDSCVCNFLEPADARWKNDFCSYFEPREE